MARPARPWWRESRKMWFVWIGGKQQPLHVTDPAGRPAADAAHAKLVNDLAAAVAAKLATPPPHPGPDIPGPDVETAVRGYLARAGERSAAGRLHPRSLRNYRVALGHLVSAFGPRPLASLTADELERWADRPGWSASYQHDNLGTVGQLLRAGGITLKLTRPPKESRGADTCLTEDQFGVVIENLYLKGGKAAGDLRELLCFLRETGFRPGEAAGLTAEAIDWAAGTATLHRHKRKRHTGRAEVRQLSPAAVAILVARREKYGTGPLFRTRGGGKAYAPNVIVKQLIEVSRRVGFRVIAYGLGRHAAITRALVNGVPEAVVAALVGTSTQMIARHYSHVGNQVEVLKAAAAKASRAAG